MASEYMKRKSMSQGEELEATYAEISKLESDLAAANAKVAALDNAKKCDVCGYAREKDEDIEGGYVPCWPCHITSRNAELEKRLSGRLSYWANLERHNVELWAKCERLEKELDATNNTVAMLNQQLADNDLAFNHSNEVCEKQQADIAKLTRERDECRTALKEIKMRCEASTWADEMLLEEILEVVDDWVTTSTSGGKE
jgi:valyl-tRNA synthetase